MAPDAGIEARQQSEVESPRRSGRAGHNHRLVDGAFLSNGGIAVQCCFTEAAQTLSSVVERPGTSDILGEDLQNLQRFQGIPLVLLLYYCSVHTDFEEVVPWSI
jgi:hypothetical protein